MRTQLTKKVVQGDDSAVSIKLFGAKAIENDRNGVKTG